MKIALCLFGSIGSILKPKRNLNDNFIDPEICFKSIKQNIIDKFETDVFFHTWKNNYSHKLIKLYNPKAFKIEKQINFKPKLLSYSLKYIDCYNNVASLKEDDQDPKIVYENLAYRAHSRWHSQTKALEVLGNFSKRNKIKYDLVIQSRFDLIINNLPNLKDLNKKRVYLVKKNTESPKSLYDIFFISNFQVAQKIKNIKKRLYDYPIDPSQALYFFFQDETINYKNFIEFKDIILYRYLVRKNNFFKKIIFLFIFCPLNLFLLFLKKIHKTINKFLNHE